MNQIVETKIFEFLKIRDDFTRKEYNTKLARLQTCLDEEYGKIDTYFENYTKHDWTHTLNVLQYMFELVANPAALNSETLMLMIYSAVLHDIGMAFSEPEAKNLKDINSAMTKAQIQEYLRINHGKLAAVKLQQLKRFPDFYNVFLLSVGGVNDDFDLSELLSTICESHTRSLRWLYGQLYNREDAVFVACLLRIADLLDIDGKRANYYYQLSRQIQGESLAHFTFNQALGGIDKIKNRSCSPCLTTCPNYLNNNCGKKTQQIELQITIPTEINSSNEARIRRMVSDYADEIEQEIQSISGILRGLSDTSYRINLSPLVEVKYTETRPASHPRIDTYRINIDYPSVRRLFLGKQLYPDSLYGIREIVQNGYDACKARMSIANYIPRISIKYDKSAHTISIIDNGIGMTDIVIKEYFLNIGKSIYNSEADYLFCQRQIDHIGFFGLGFFAVFMLADNARIITKSLEAGKAIEIEVDSSLNYATLTTHPMEPIDFGTTIILNLTDVCKKLKCDNEDQCFELICDYVRDTFLFDGIKIECIETEENGTDQRSEIPLPNIESVGMKTNISPSFLGVEAKATVADRKLDSLFWVQINGTDVEIQKISYNDLLYKLQQTINISKSIPYMNMGNFQLFSADSKIIEIWENQIEAGGRINYAPWSSIGGGIITKIKTFCEEWELSVPTHCDIMTLYLLVDGHNVALCKENVVCSRHLDNMIKYDACGEAQRNDKIYLRDVCLPKVHVIVPWLNYRYQFNELIVNIKTDDVFPIITRDNLSTEHTQKFNYALGYAISSISKNDYDRSENQLIRNTFYKEIDDNYFIRK